TCCDFATVEPRKNNRTKENAFVDPIAVQRKASRAGIWMSSQTAIRITASPCEVSAAQHHSDPCRRSETLDVLFLCLSSGAPRGNAISKKPRFRTARTAKHLRIN